FCDQQCACVRNAFRCSTRSSSPSISKASLPGRFRRSFPSLCLTTNLLPGGCAKCSTKPASFGSGSEVTGTGGGGASEGNPSIVVNRQRRARSCASGTSQSRG